MEKLLRFFKTTALGGLLVLLPILLLCLLLGEVFQLFLALATPIAALFPEGFFDDAKFPVILSILLFLAVSFLIGLAMRSSKAHRLGQWAAAKSVDRLPMYRFVKTLITGLIGSEENVEFAPALLTMQGGIREFAYIVEKHDNGDMTVLVPMAPSGFSGPVKIVSREHVQVLDASLGDVSRVLNHLGLGGEKVIRTRM